MEGRMQFTYQFEIGSPKITVTLGPQTGLPEALSSFQAFLKAAGYSFNGELVIEEDTNA